MPEMQGTGNTAVVIYRKFPVTKQIRYDRQSRRVLTNAALHQFFLAPDRSRIITLFEHYKRLFLINLFY